MPTSSPLTGIRTLDALLERLPDGDGGRTLAHAIGAWTPSAHRGGADLDYPSQLATVTDEQLTELHGLWADRYAAMSEVVGLLEGQKVLAGLATKAAKASARAALRRRVDADGKPVKYTLAALDDEIATASSVLDREQVESIVDVALASARAYKDGAAALMGSTSRAMSLRQAQYAGRMRG